MATIRGVGAMRETLTIQTNTPPALVVTSLTRSGTTAIAVTAEPHPYQSGDYVVFAGALEPGWNGRPKILVIGPAALSFPALESLPSPATGTITVTYGGDPQAGRRSFWQTLCRIRAAIDPIRTDERLERGTIRSNVELRFRVHRRTDIPGTARVLWTPSAGGPERTLMLVGPPLPVGDGRRFMDLEVTAAALMPIGVMATVTP